MSTTDIQRSEEKEPSLPVKWDAATFALRKYDEEECWCDQKERNCQKRLLGILSSKGAEQLWDAIVDSRILYLNTGQQPASDQRKPGRGELGSSENIWHKRHRCR